VLEVRAKPLQTELVAKKVEKTLLMGTTESRVKELSGGYSRMRELPGGGKTATARTFLLSGTKPFA
jgi:circadian clock protein KaiC